MNRYPKHHAPRVILHPATLGGFALAALGLLLVFVITRSSPPTGINLSKASIHAASGGGGIQFQPLIGQGTTATSRPATGSQPLTVITGPATLVPLATAPPPPPAAPAQAVAPSPTPVVAADGTKVLVNPNNTYPPDLDPNRPFGPPVIRTDWVISKDYAAHGGHSEWGALDFAYWYDTGAMGSEIVATHAGIVRLIPNDPIYGNWVWVINDQFTTRYGHNRKYLVSEGQQVVRGTLLAEMGSTGNSTGPHVDYQVWQDNDNKNPMDWLK